MHELSIIKCITEIADTEVRKNHFSAVEKIELEIGELAGIDWNALNFAWDVGVKKSVLEHADRVIIRIPGKSKCLDCECIFHSRNLYDACPECGSYVNQVLSGKELRVKTLTLI